MHQRLIITLIPNRNDNFIYVSQKYNFSIGFKRNEIASRSREDLVTFRDSSMQDCNHLPSLVSRGWRRATGDDEEEEAKRTENVERGGERGKQEDGQGDGERAERERTRASGRQRAEGGGRRTEGGGQRTEDGRWRTERGNEGKKRRGATTRYRFGNRSARVYTMLDAQREKKAAERNRRPDALYIEAEPHEQTARGA